MFANKHVLVVGLATSGIPVVKVLHQLNAIITITDIKSEEALEALLNQIKGCYNQSILGCQPHDISPYDLIVLSPGVPTDLPFIVAAKEKNKEIIGEIELAYRLVKGKYIAITGTNGKTTTTSLLYEMYKAEGLDAHAVGNIGKPPIAYFGESTDATVFVTEVSSFQLESTSQFRPHVASILNITPDHLNRHKTMDAYIDAKCQVFKAMTNCDYLILNYDNPVTRQIQSHVPIVYFSKSNHRECHVFISEGTIFVREGLHAVEIIDVDEILIPGGHNVENALAAIAMAYFDDLSLAAIRYALKSFKGVEHRIEPVAKINGVQYYNDSKGTNPDSTIKAVEAMTAPTLLIAGGMDKGSSFDALIDTFYPHIVQVILFGETKHIIAEACIAKGYHQVVIVNTLKEAVLYAASQAKNGENVLLSPACASWDMYPNFEVRGKEFKSLVLELNAYE